MRAALEAIRSHRKLQLQLIVTGMHLDPRHGRTLDEIESAGWEVDAIVPWGNHDSGAERRVSGESPSIAETGDDSCDAALAIHTGRAISGIAAELDRLKPDIVLVVGDRVEAFAAATAAHLSGRVLAHVHGGDRALGLVDECLRHAITKLAHVHFPATARSAARIRRMGEDPWRIHLVGSPGLDDLHTAAPPAEIRREFPELKSRQYALMLLHPCGGNAGVEHQRAEQVISAIALAGFQEILAIYPNNDPGAEGIIAALKRHESQADQARLAKQARPSVPVVARRNVPRRIFLGLLRDAAALVGNSSSGIIEAASFGLPVIDIGDRQKGRERGKNVIHVEFETRKIQAALRRIWHGGEARRFASDNLYSNGKSIDAGPGLAASKPARAIPAGQQVAGVLAAVRLDAQLRHKLIAF
jgi:UDP-N-acetylglucosamine 2-epimerase (non-hydrolysing)/GDP/UDP-N,N'-diacetylbacillosamine 2-epimerase (hydrolysing)